MVKTIKVLLMYQYGEGVDDSPQQRFITETEKRLNGAKVQNFNIVADRLWDASSVRASTTVLTMFVSAVENYDYAIALFTLDERKASEAGNLWFEVGYWYARRGGNNLLIIKYLTGDDKFDNQVRIPSDLGGVVSRDVKSAAEAFSEFNKLLGEVRDPSSPRRVLENFMDKINRGTWIEQEREEIEIVRDENLDQKHEALKGFEIYRCINKVTRIIDESPSELIFLAQIGRHGTSDFTYRVCYGTGLLNAEEQARLNDYILNKITGTSAGLQDIFEISDLKLLSRDGKAAHVKYKHELGRHLNGRRFVYTAEWDTPVSGPTTVSFTIKSVFLGKHRWHQYLTHLSIKRELIVSMEAPYRLIAFPNVWPLQEIKPVEYPLGDRYCSQISIEGPVFAGSEIRWIDFSNEGHVGK